MTSFTYDKHGRRIPIPEQGFDSAQTPESVLAAALHKKEEEFEEPNVVDTMLYLSKKTAKMGEIIDDFNTAKLLSSGIPNKTVTLSSGKVAPMFVESPYISTDVFGNKDIRSMASDNLGKTTRPWSSTMYPNPEVVNDAGGNLYDTTEKISTYLEDEVGLKESDASNLIAHPTEKNKGQLGTVSDSMLKGTKPSNFFKTSEKILGSDASIYDKIGFNMGKVGTAASVGMGLGRAKKGYEKGEFDETVHGLIDAASPWLLGAGPAGWTVLGINTIWDMFD